MSQSEDGFACVEFRGKGEKAKEQIASLIYGVRECMYMFEWKKHYVFIPVLLVVCKYSAIF